MSDPILPEPKPTPAPTNLLDVANSLLKSPVLAAVVLVGGLYFVAQNVNVNPIDPDNPPKPAPVSALRELVPEEHREAVALNHKAWARAVLTPTGVRALKDTVQLNNAYKNGIAAWSDITGRTGLSQFDAQVSELLKGVLTLQVASLDEVLPSGQTRRQAFSSTMESISLQVAPPPE